MASGIFNKNQILQGLAQGAWSGTGPSNAPKQLEYLVVAGGGGGGYEANGGAGGGGAGGLLQGILLITLGTSYSVTVGSGGATSTSSTVAASNGQNSSFGSITALGGGGGSARLNAASGGSGGAGGDGTNGTIWVGGQGTFGQGNKGGIPITSYNSAPGGGGAGTVGLNATPSTIGSNGGAGITSSISGVLTAYAGGGAGGAGPSGGSTGGTGGVGGGGNSGYNNGSTNFNPQSGGANTGGGGGGTGNYTGYGSVAGAAGGSGIVIVRYPGNIQYFSGGTLNYDSVNNYTVHSFYSSGTLAPLATPVTYGTTNQLTKSLRFRSSNSAYMNRTPSSTTNRQTWTFSAWVKRANLTSSGVIFEAAVDTNNRTTFYLEGPDGYFTLQQYTSGSADFQLNTTPIYKDTSAWYHFVIVANTTNATQANRLQIYVNNVLQPVTGSLLNQNLNTYVNANNVHNIGKYIGNALALDSYLTDVYLIDGQALTPSSFGLYDPTSGVWSPMAYSGTYGTNGFHLPFTNTTSTTTLGYDTSGNGNNWSTSGFSLTAGSTYDSMNDVPTLTSATASNYAVINANAFAGPTLTNGNLNQSGSSGVSQYIASTIGMTGNLKYYCEIICVLVGAEFAVGICTDQGSTNYVGGTATSWGYYVNGNKYTNGSGTSYGSTYTTGDVIGIAFDAGAGTLTFYKNNVSQGTAFTGLTSGPYFFTMSTRTSGGTSTGTINFGQQPFTYTPPSGYNALNTYNLPTPTIVRGNKYMDASLYNGNGGTNVIMNAGQFQPDFVWIKSRSNTYDNNLFDSVRPSGYVLASNNNGAEANYSPYFTGINSNGFSLANSTLMNSNGNNFVAWQWQAGKGNNVTNNDGSVTSTVSVNQTAGFSIVNWTPSAGNDTVGHGLGAVPSMIIAKPRVISSAWPVYHSALGPTKVMELNQLDAASSGTTTWNNTTPTSTVFSTASWFSNSGATIAYVWTPIPGFSAFGSYTGGSSTVLPFVYTGFRPRFIMIKNSSYNGGYSSWFMIDTARLPGNISSGTVPSLWANLSAAEGYRGNGSSTDTYDYVNILSNGFQIADTGTSDELNNPGNIYVYAAFAENPFKYALAR